MSLMKTNFGIYLIQLDSEQVDMLLVYLVKEMMHEMKTEYQMEQDLFW